MKRIFTTLILLCSLCIGFAQSGFVSIGNNISNPSVGSVSYTYGQVFASFIEAPGTGNISEGVQQPYLIIVELTDEICQDLDTNAKYTNNGFNIPIQNAGTFNDSIYLVAGSYLGYDSLTKLTLTVHPIYFGTDTLLIYDNQLPYLYALNDTAFDTLSTTGVHRVTLTTEYGCDSIIDVMIFAVTCPTDTSWVAPYNVCTVPANASVLPQPAISPADSTSPITLTNNVPNEFVVGDTNIVTWTYSVAGKTLSCDQNVFIAYPPCGDTVVAYDGDGNLYHTVRVACICWTKENLRPTHYTDGTEIPANYVYNAPGYSNTNSNLSIYGRLYDWYSAVNVPNGYVGTVSDTVQGICPTGWHIPTSLEYGSLASYTSQSLKTPNYWITPGDNSSGWTGVPGGYYSGIGFYQMSGNAYYWSSDTKTSVNAIAFTISFSCSYCNLDEEPMKYAYSVRCVKN
ncbi:MAG: fibrobacter succinogenes major paralogous domain-containing protein [Bacteroidales bacterium]|nr:fibrobacter succinogenes major paralogous domain-containing protein [Bacteroidales bacterium]